jgi:hypothetical protein
VTVNASVIAASESTTGWVVGYTVAIVVVLVVVALVVPILVLAHTIGQQAATINDSLTESVRNTAALKELDTTKDHLGIIAAGLRRGRERLGG